MELNEIRQGINEIDRQIEELFVKRMGLCCDVAEYKLKNGLPVFQAGRENEILERVRGDMPEELKGGAGVLFTTIMDISKTLQFERVFSDRKPPESEPLDLTRPAVCAVPGISGAYSHFACRKFSDKFTPRFYDSFPEVFRAVDSGEAAFGVVPIVNSTAGSVGQTYELLREFDLKICSTCKLKITHCLAAKKGVKAEEIKEVWSHDQALMQCSQFISEKGLHPHRCENTSLAAKLVAESSKPCGAICSEECAAEQGLEVIARGIANADQNYTRFILISKKTLCPADADTVSVSLALPHESSSLYRLLTKFSAAGLNLTMIESRPIANTDFDVVFYLDFEGSLQSPPVAKLLAELEYELSYFKFLGSYSMIADNAI